MADYEDPGWRAAIRGVGWFVVPIIHIWAIKRKADEDGLTAHRRVFLGLVDSLFLFIIVCAYIEPWNGGREGVAPYLVALIGSLNLLGIGWLRRQPLTGDTAERLATNYRANFFIGVGLATAPALAALCGTLIVGSLWIYLVGLAISLIGFVLIAPTRANIERRQREIQASGSTLSLWQALMDMTPPGRN